MLKLTPKVHKQVREYLSDKTRVQELTNSLGSPLNILFPQLASDNAKAFLRVFNKHKIKGRVFCAHKPNKSQAIVRQLALENVGIDGASHGELLSALQAGFIGERIEATGPKNEKFIRLALQHGVIIAVDSMDELLLVSKVLARLNMQEARVLLRVSGFTSTHTKVHGRDTRFGINIKDLDSTYQWLRDHKEMRLLGLSFHLNAANATEKIIAIENTLNALVKASSYGLSPSVINIGGGFHISYLESGEEWDQYISSLKRSVLEGTEILSWDQSGLGYRNENGTLGGSAQFADSFVSKTASEEFEKILNSPLPSFDNASFKQVLDELLFEFWIEPGRAILDQAGMTVARVLSVKQSAKDETVVVLDMNRSNLNSPDLMVLADPTVLYQRPKESSESVGVFFAGNLCLKSDLLTRHKTFFTQLPEPGDLVVFHNTAAYMMDFAESHTLQQDIAEKVAITETNGAFSWCLDDNYEPL